MKQVTEADAVEQTKSAFIQMVKDLKDDLSLNGGVMYVTTNDQRLYDIIDAQEVSEATKLDETHLEIGDSNIIKVNGQRLDFNPAKLYPPVYEHDGKKYFGQPKRFATYWG